MLRNLLVVSGILIALIVMNPNPIVSNPNPIVQYGCDKDCGAG